METPTALLARCEGNHPSRVDSLHEWPVMRTFDVSLLLNREIAKQTLELPVIWDAITLMWHHCDGTCIHIEIPDLKPSIHLVLRRKYFGRNRPRTWLLVPWPLASPNHQKPWYWLCRKNAFLFPTSHCFNYLSNLLKNNGKLKMSFFFSSNCITTGAKSWWRH